MPVRPGVPSQEGFPSPSPSADTHSNDPFSSQHVHGRRGYFDTESDIDYTRRDAYRETYGSDGSSPAVNEQGYYDGPHQYEMYRELLVLPFFLPTF
jgi:1,3-beta-glucan synthase